MRSFFINKKSALILIVSYNAKRQWPKSHYMVLYQTQNFSIRRGPKRRRSLKTSLGRGFLHLLDFQKWCRKARDGLAALFIFAAYHWYDGLCYFVSNTFSFIEAVFVMSLVLFLASLAFVYLHEFMARKYSWDMLGLERLKELGRDVGIPRHRIFKKLLKRVLSGGYWAIYLLGPLTIGPPIVAILLRKKKNLKQNLSFIIPGTLLSAVFWVSVWTGVGALTWNQFILPLLEHAF
jgi:hypothetical protein